VLKINKIRGDKRSGSQKLLIQIIDMSDKMLYNEIKAERSFLTLINAAISHELRNPLNSLIG
jgi:signal transduction histidine kinase